MNTPNTPTPPPQRRELFLRARELDGAEREAFLTEACADDEGLLRDLEELLSEESGLDGFLDQPAMAKDFREGKARAGSASNAGLKAGPALGGLIGRYRLLEEIGEGGCGLVYMAEQLEPVRRRVALKVLKPGMDTRSVIARFEAERQALAMMDHPNIARVLDGGETEAGLPFFVMDLVRGLRITDYCDQHSLGIEDRLKLLLPVCQAVQHAHQKGIIHRDLKPSNILVAHNDGAAAPQVIDFGIAKAIGQKLTEKTLFTHFQSFVGTPAYSSPEQIEMSGLDVDTRGDIYSLGVLMYELLTGTQPFNAERLVSSGLDEMRRIIREVDPPRPSSRLGTLGVTEAEKVSRTRRGELPQLVAAAKGDLDWIIMKCLEKDRDRRYASADALMADLQNFLRGDAVLARPPSSVYRVRKFARRNRVAVAAATSVALALALAAGVSIREAVRANQAEQEQKILRQAAERAQKSQTRERLRAEAEELKARRQAYDSDMNLAQQALAANNYARLVDLLERHRPKPEAPDFRGWEWRYYWSQAKSQAAFALPRQTNAIVALAVAPNGRLLASGDGRGTVKLWDLATLRTVAVPRPWGWPAGGFAFSKDGSRFAVIESVPRQGSTVRVWDVATRQVAEVIPFNTELECVVFASADSELLAVDRDLNLWAWDFSAKRLQQRGEAPLQQPRAPMRRCFTFSPQADRLAFTAERGLVQVVDTRNGLEVASISGIGHEIASLTFTPDGSHVAVGPLFLGTETDVVVFSTETGKESARFVGNRSWVPGVAFSPDGSRLVSAGADQNVRVWETNGGQETTALRGHRAEINCVVVAPGGKKMFSGSKDGVILAWDLDQVKPRTSYEILPGKVSDLAFFPDGRAALVARDGGMASLWDTSALEFKEPVPELGREPALVLVSPNGKSALSTARSGGTRVIDWTTRLPVANGGAFESKALPIGYLDEGRLLAMEREGGVIQIWDTTRWTLRNEWELAGNKWRGGPRGWMQGRRSRLTTDGRWLFEEGEAWSIIIRDPESGAVNGTYTRPSGETGSLLSSPGGDLLAAASIDGTISFWKPGSATPFDTVRAHLLGVHSLAFSTDGGRLASVSASGEAVKLWDTVSRHDVATLAGEGSIFNRAWFSPDGRVLAALNRDGRLHVWRAPTLREIDEAEVGIR